MPRNRLAKNTAASLRSRMTGGGVRPVGGAAA
jgi:hypothetical protein